MSILPTNQANSRVFILHPDFAHKGLYLSELINQFHLVYIKLSDEIATSQEAFNWIDQNRASIHYTNNLETLLVLDEIDHLSTQVLADVVSRFIDCHNMYILLITRSMLDISAFDGDIKHKMQIVMPTYPVVSQSSDHILDVTGFGIGRVRMNGCDINLIPNEKTQDLLFYILENRVTTRNQILSVVWGHLDKGAAITNFHVTRQKLNDKLGIEFLKLQAGYYQINPEITINYDVDSYRNLLKEFAYHSDDTQPEQYQMSYDLYHHDFLLKSTAEWITSIRETLRKMQSDVCYQLAISYQVNLDSIGLLSQAFRYNPYREDIAHVMMTIYQQENLPCDALTVYNILQANLDHLGAIKPAKPLTQLMEVAEINCHS